MTPLIQKLLILTLSTMVLVWISHIALGRSQFRLDWQEALSDPYGCSLSPDNFGCELNRPFDKEKKDQQEAPFVSKESRNSGSQALKVKSQKGKIQ